MLRAWRARTVSGSPRQRPAREQRTGFALIAGGGQEFGLRSGTENTASAAGLAKALELAQAKRAAEQKKVGELRNYFEEQTVLQPHGGDCARLRYQGVAPAQGATRDYSWHVPVNPHQPPVPF